MRTREEHLAWCKERALEYCDAGDIAQAFASMASDMQKCNETRADAAFLAGLSLMVNGQLSTPADMRRFIEGFN